MQNTEHCGKIRTRDGYLLCPICQRQKVLRILPETSGSQIPVWCKNCRKESIVDIPKSLSLSQRA